MDTRNKIKTRKLKEEERSKRKPEVGLWKALQRGTDKLIGSNDIIVSPSDIKVNVEEEENSNPVKQEVGEEEDVKVEQDVEVVTVDEKVDLEEEPCVELEGTVEAGNPMEGPSALVSVPEAGPTSQPPGKSSAPTTPLEEKVNYLASVVGSMSAELKEVKEKLSKVSPEMPPPPPPITTGTSSTRDPPDMEVPEGGVNRLDLVAESRSASEDEAGSKHCLVCYKDVPSSSDDILDDRTLIDKQLHVIFILNKLLCIPPTSLGKFLEMFPDANPASWINLCGECGEVVEKAWRIHCEIVNDSKKLKRIQEQVISKIKDFTMGPQDTSATLAEPSDIGTVVTRESRKFVKEQNYGHLQDPFPNGDLEASRRLTEEGMKNEEKTSEKSKRTQQIRTKVVSSEADVLRSKLRVTKSKNRISRRKKSPKTLTAKPWKAQFSVGMEMETSTKLKAAPRSTKERNVRPKYSCDQCEKVFPSKMGLFLHKKAMHEKAPFKYRENIRKLGNTDQRKCRYCDLITDKYYLRRHIKRVHELADAVTCEICGIRCSCLKAIDRHKAERHGICSLEGCRQEFPGDRRGLRNHQLEAHGREINVFKCDNCGKLCTRVDRLRRHRRHVHGSRKLGAEKK